MGRMVTLARGRWDGNKLVDIHDLFVTDARIGASRVAFGRDGFLYWAVGGPPGPADAMASQDPMQHTGKTLRLRDDGTVPDNNPFAGRAGYKPEIYSLGHRNQLGLTVNPITGDIWETEQGPQGGDEVNIILPGRNYGWPLVSFGRWYEGPRVSENPYRDGMELPVVSPVEGKPIRRRTATRASSTDRAGSAHRLQFSLGGDTERADVEFPETKNPGDT